MFKPEGFDEMMQAINLYVKSAPLCLDEQKWHKFVVNFYLKEDGSTCFGFPWIEPFIESEPEVKNEFNK